jgi:hypothetical protein
VAPGGDALQLGIATRGARLAAWQRDCLEALHREPAARLAAWLRADGEEGPPPPTLAGLTRVQADATPTLDAWLELDPVEDRLALARTARRGIWVLHHRCAAPGVLEVHRDEPVTTARLIEIDGAGATRTLRTGTLATVPGSVTRNRRALLQECARWPAEACRHARSGGLHGDVEVLPAPEPAPGLARRWTEAPRLLLRRLGHLVTRATSIDLWNVGIVRVPIERFLTGPVQTVEWMPAPDTTRLRADPFGLWRNGEATVVYEGLDYSAGRGFLAARTVDERGFGPEREVLHQPCHLSYPFLIEEGGEVFCVPESHEAGEIGLWRAAPFPERWEKHAVIRAGYPGIDSSLVRHEGRWWCFTSRRDDGHASRLDVFWADALEGPWQPHAANPVLIDARATRGAGTPFVHEGVLYRPAQDYSRKLEHRITIRRVLELTPERFREETAVRLEPIGDGPYPDKLHTLGALGPWTLVDGARQVPAWRVRGGLRFKARRLLRR